MRQPLNMYVDACVKELPFAPLQRDNPLLASDDLNACKVGRPGARPQPNPPLQLRAERGQDGTGAAVAEPGATPIAEKLSGGGGGGKRALLITNAETTRTRMTTTRGESLDRTVVVSITILILDLSCNFPNLA